MAELATFPAMESAYELLESLRIQLPDYEICKASDTKFTMLAGVPLDFAGSLDGLLFLMSFTFLGISWV